MSPQTQPHQVSGFCGWEGDREEKVSRGQGQERILSGRRLWLIGHATLGILESAVGRGWVGRNKGS